MVSILSELFHEKYFIMSCIITSLVFGFIAWKLFDVFSFIEGLRSVGATQEFLSNSVSALKLPDSENAQVSGEVGTFAKFLYWWIAGLFMSYSLKCLVSIHVGISRLYSFGEVDSDIPVNIMNMLALMLEFLPYIYGVLTNQLEFSFHCIYLLSLPHLFGMLFIPPNWAQFASGLFLIPFSMIEAGVISWKLNHSVWMAIFHGFFNLLYILVEVLRSGGPLELLVCLAG
jgi:hypothetical protein